MNVAVVVPAVGSPGALATTAFIGALADGLTALGEHARVIGLPFYETDWRPQALGESDAAAPWLQATPRGLRDRAEALHRGIFEAEGPGEPPVRWRLELLLERELERFAPRGADNLLIADTRSALQLRIACRVARRLGWRVVVVSNEALTAAQIDPATRAEYIERVARCASGVWAFSEHLARFWEDNGVASEHVFVSPPPVRATSFGSVEAPPDPERAGYLGNLAHREIDSLLTIAQTVAARRPSFRLTIMGDATTPVRNALAEKIAVHGLSGIVTVEPSVLPTDVPLELATFAVLLLPRASGEFSAAGFPNKLGEYLASGRPVVVAAVGDIPRYLTDGEHAVLVAPDDPEAFATAVLGVLDSPDSGTAIGHAGHDLAEKLLRSDAVAGRLMDFVAGLPAPPDATGPTAQYGSAGLAALLPDPDLFKRDVRRALRRTPRA